jgi:hypothetical protein
MNSGGGRLTMADRAIHIAYEVAYLMLKQDDPWPNYEAVRASLDQLARKPVYLLATEITGLSVRCHKGIMDHVAGRAHSLLSDATLGD